MGRLENPENKLCLVRLESKIRIEYLKKKLRFR